MVTFSSGKVSVLFLDKDRARVFFEGKVISTETGSSCSLAIFFKAISNSLKATPVVEVETVELFSIIDIEVVRLECCSTFVVSIVVELDELKLVCCCCWWWLVFVATLVFDRAVVEVVLVAV
jgi:hypothetical protein